MTAPASGQIRFQWRSSLLLAAASAAGFAAFTWPLFTRPHGSENLAHTGDAPWVFIVLVPLLELCPELALPSGGRLTDMLAALGAGQEVRRAGPPLL